MTQERGLGLSFNNIIIIRNKFERKALVLKLFLVIIMSLRPVWAYKPFINLRPLIRGKHQHASSEPGE